MTSEMMANPPYILGIDPGLSGAMALLSIDDGALLTICDTPTVGKTLNVYGVGSWLDAHSHQIKHAVVEEVHAMPGQGVSSMFKFGFVTGAIHGALGAMLIPITTVPPSTWKRQMRLPADKDASRALAMRLFPRHHALFARKKDDGRAESALLAEWWRRHNNENSQGRRGAPERA